MKEVTAYEIDDQFDPLEDLGIDEIDEDEEAHEYLPPIPDAELSRVPEKVPMTPRESIEKMFVGMPGQKHRILEAIKICSDWKLFDEMVQELDEQFPTEVSVFNSAQVFKLLEDAQAIEKRERAGEGSAQEAAQPEGDYLVVTPAQVFEYRATDEGNAVVEEHRQESAVTKVLLEDEKYLPLYCKILTMTSEEGGCQTNLLDETIDPDPLCEEPKRFCTYFLKKLEETGAVYWQDAWVASDLGVAALESDVFAGTERS